MSAPRNTLSILVLNQSDCRPTEVIWTFITFPRVTLLSELVCFHSRQHRCWRIWIIHAICVIYVFAYSWKHKCVCAVLLLGRQMKTSAEFRAAKEEIFFFCNSVMKLDSVRIVVSQKTMTDACCTATEGTEEGLFCFCLCSWLTGCQPHFVTSSPEQ